MVLMLQSRLKAPVTKLITPICNWAISAGVTANGVSIVGAFGASAAALFFYPRGELFIGTLVVSLFILSDLFDGTIARLSNTGGTRWGAFLDSTLDRTSDAALCIGLWFYLNERNDPNALLALIILFFGALIPYLRARSEALGIACSVGIAERAERLIILLVGVGLAGLGISAALTLALWILAVAGLVTIGQRVAVVYRA